MTSNLHVTLAFAAFEAELVFIRITIVDGLTAHAPMAIGIVSGDDERHGRENERMREGQA